MSADPTPPSVPRWQETLLITLVVLLVVLTWPHLYNRLDPDLRIAANCSNDFDCINGHLQQIVKEQSPEEALRVANKLSRLAPLAAQGHTFAHEIGYATYDRYRTLGDRLQACNDTLGSGCYHGVMMLFISQPENKGADLSQTCVPFAGRNPRAMYTDCVHGIGHGLMMRQLMTPQGGGGWREIKAALRECDRITVKDGSEESFCKGGVFMEYRVAATLKTFHYPNPPAYPARDLHWPCNLVTGVTKTVCYNYQGTLIALNAPSYTAAFKECASAGGEAAERCASSIGRDRVTGTLKEDKQTATQICGAAADSHLRQVCFIDSARYYLYLDRNVQGALDMCELPGIHDAAACKQEIREEAAREYGIT